MHTRYTVAISDDHPHIINSLKMLFAKNDRFSVTSETVCGKSLLAALASTPADIVITDFSLSSDRSTIDGFPKLRALHGRFPDVKVILLTSLNNTAILRGACDYGVKSLISKSDAIEETVQACQHITTHPERYFSSSFAHIKNYLVKGQEKGSPLTPKELDVIRLFSSGYTLSEIAHRQNRTISTISTQKYNAMRRLGVSSNVELIRYAYAQGLI